MKIYLDLVFLSNFLGDFICLMLCGAIYRPTRLWRSILAAAVGGIYGMAAVLPGMSVLGTLPVKAAFAAVIAAVAYLPVKKGELLRMTVTFLISSMLLCGGTELILSAGGNGVVLFALLGGAGLIFCAVFALKSRIYARYLPCELCYQKKKCRFYGFYDSGNRLFTAENGMRVIVASESVLKDLIAPEVTEANLAEWVNEPICIPFSGAAGGIMQGIRLDYAKVLGRRYNDVVLAVCKTSMADKVILHSTMV